jgi:hypothetical protein
LHATVATLVDEQAIARLRVGKRIDSHPESIAGLPTSWGGRPRPRSGRGREGTIGEPGTGTRNRGV